jgi:hypothetical protein
MIRSREYLYHSERSIKAFCTTFLQDFFLKGHFPSRYLGLGMKEERKKK